MYQESVIMEDMYGYPTSWIHGNNGQTSPTPLMTSMLIKQEQSIDFQDSSATALMSPSSSCTNQYYHPLQHQVSVSATSAPTLNGGFYSGYQNNAMCQPLIMDDRSSNVSSPDLAASGQSVLPPSPNDVFSSTSSPTIDDQWGDLYSPTTHYHHRPPTSYFIEQRHSFDDSMFSAFNTNTRLPVYMDNKQNNDAYYHHSTGTNSNNNMMGNYQVNVSAPSPTPSSSSSSSSPYQPITMMVARHYSVPSIYDHQHRHHHYPQHQHHVPSSMTVASDIRPYQCHICSRSFARKHDLQRHIRVHTGDKPYTCLCCKKAFARTDALKRHLRMEEVCRTSPQVQAMKITGKRRYKNL